MRRLVLVPALALVLVAAGCGDDSNDSATEHLEGPVWQLVQLVGTDLPDDVVPTLQLLDGVASGQAGCNSFTGGYELDGRDLAIGPLATTRMACAPPLDEVEAAYLGALEQVASFDVNENELVLRDADDTPVLFYEVPIGAL